ncbi:uncharacterized protein LOC108167023 [Poecilia reticulata]|uniref:uncharacterized protein LOC108167023 n=1 Tax=Poecilia reticulata TaxID=8081 RepID=UPI0007EBE801|nr:PREDICTED: uncharacterized protein LOC108167023 [Poecilia reticulata]
MMAEKMARKRVKVGDPSEWNAYEIKILYRNDDYLKARQKCLLAEEVSNLDTEMKTEVQEGRRKRKRNRTLVHSDDEEERLKPRKGLPQPPAAPKPPVPPNSRQKSIMPLTPSGVNHFHSLLLSPVQCIQFLHQPTPINWEVLYWVNTLAFIGGKDLRATVYNMLPKIILNSLAQQYSFLGWKGKRSLSAHKQLLTVIFRAVRKSHGAESLQDMEI